MVKSNYTRDEILLKKELDEFGELLDSAKELKERDDVLKFFDEREHLSAFIGLCNGNIDRVDYVKREFNLFKKYKPDLVVGDIEKAEYCFIEFENAEKYSIFSSPTKSGKTSWASRFGGGLGQLSDWMMELDTNKNHKNFHKDFGDFDIDIKLILVIGRDEFLIDDQSDRIKCFGRNVSIYGKKLSIYTFDSLYQSLVTKYENVIGTFAKELEELEEDLESEE